ncbi:hypothetical protein F5Y16DRAFT_393092 [Xylariaceae sp. FL0255]|nr:hypothetical protein F5Y16DRAFT_393092 [Xylariaceae sp. FL0255]
MASNGPAHFPPGYAEQNLGWITQAVAILFIVLEILAVAARFGTRYHYKTKWGLDDYLIIPALIFCLGICITAVVEVHVAHIGRHLTVLEVEDPQAIVAWFKFGYVIETLYGASVAFPKLSVIAFYLRVFVDRTTRLMTKILGVVIALIGLAIIITSLAQCRPFSARWNPALSATACINPTRYWQASSTLNVTTDVIVLLLPLPMVWKLQIDKAQKAALGFVFLLGSFGIVASVIRLTTVFDVNSLVDGTWATATIAMWSFIEGGVVLISSCLPVLRPLFVSFSGKISSVVTKLTNTSSRTRTSLPMPHSEDGQGLKPKDSVYVQMDTWQTDSFVDEEAQTGIPNGVSTSVNGPFHAH